MAQDVTRWQDAKDRALARYQQMTLDLQKMKETAMAEISPELLQVADIYKTGGEYGAGARGAILERERAGVAAGQSGLVRSGMSSGSLAAGVKARYSRQAQQGLQEVEDIRYERLGSALSAVAAAKAARGERMSQAYMSSAQLIGGFQEPTVSQFSSPESVAQIGQQSDILRAYLSSKSQRPAQTSLIDWNPATNRKDYLSFAPEKPEK